MCSFPTIGRYRFQLELLDPLRLPHYPGSAWRGLLGHGLRRAVCVTRQPRCEGCLLLSGCAYSRLFETPAGDCDPPRHNYYPHPYVLVVTVESHRDHKAGDPLTLGINLIGAANNTLPYLVHALNLAGERGLTSSHSRFRLTAVEQLGDDDKPQTVYTPADGMLAHSPLTPPVPPARAGVNLELLTPLRLKTRGKLLGPREFTLDHLRDHLLRRIDILARVHGDGPIDIGPAKPGSPDISMQARLRWHDWTRYSSRQHTEMQMGGLLGELSLSGSGLQRLWPWLWLGQYTHLGKGTSFGLGRYRLV